MDWKRIQLVSFTTFVTKNLYMENLLLIVEVKRGMKKKTIVFGSLLAVFLMLMIPNVSALEYNVAESAIREKISEKIEYNEMKLKEKTDLSAYEKIIFTFFILLGIYALIKGEVISIFLQILIFGFSGDFLAEFLLSQGVNPFLLLVIEMIITIIVTVNKYDRFDFEIGLFIGGMLGETIASLLDQLNSTHPTNQF